MEKKKLTIQEWEEEERPREKFLSKGGSVLSNAELLAILIRTGNRDENAIELSRKILYEAGNSLQELKRFSFYDYNKFRGVGIGKEDSRKDHNILISARCPHNDSVAKGSSP